MDTHPNKAICHDPLEDSRRTPPATAGELQMRLTTAENDVHMLTARIGKLIDELDRCKRQHIGAVQQYEKQIKDLKLKVGQVEHEFGAAKHRWSLSDAAKLEEECRRKTLRIEDLQTKLRSARNALAQERAMRETSTDDGTLETAGGE